MVHFNSLVPNDAGWNPTWGGLTFILWWSYCIEFDLLTLVNIGFVETLEQLPISQIWRERVQKNYITGKWAFS